jgi:hypothetical protein
MANLESRVKRLEKFLCPPVIDMPEIRIRFCTSADDESSDVYTLIGGKLVKIVEDSKNIIWISEEDALL